MPDLVVLVGNPRPGSRTRDAAVQVAEMIAPMFADAGPVVIDLAEHIAIGFTDDPVHPAIPAPNALDEVQNARVLVVATPSYKGTFTGLLKVFLDRLGHEALRGTLAVPVAVAGSPAHVASTADALGRLMFDLGAQVVEPIGLLDSRLTPDDIRTQVSSVLPSLATSVPS